DEHLERVGVLALGGRAGAVGGGAAQRRLEHRAFVVAHQQAYGGRFAVGVADAQVGGVHGQDAAVGAADAVAALPAGQLEGLGDAGAGAGGVRPGGEVGERLAGDLLGRVAEEFLGVLVPGRDGAGAVDLQDGDPDPSVGEGEEVGGQGRTGRAGAHGALRQVQLEPDGLVGGRVLHAPAGGQRRAQLEAASALPVEAAHGDGGALEGDLAFRIPVGHLDPHTVVAAQTEQVGGGAGVHHGVGHQFAGENDGVVDDV